MLAPRNVVASHFTFQSTMEFEFIFVQGVRSVSRFLFGLWACSGRGVRVEERPNPCPDFAAASPSREVWLRRPLPASRAVPGVSVEKSAAGCVVGWE